MNTLLLDTGWDLSVNTLGNIAMTTGNYAMAQDVASACRLFYGELWYNNTTGVPYFEDILGESPPRSLIRSHLKKAALTVPGVIDAKVYIDSIAKRKLVGRVQFTDATGILHDVVI
jgi:hypothetical protein